MEDTICFLNSLPTWGGGEKWLLDMAQWMARDHKVCVAARPFSELGRRAHGSGLQVSSEASIGNLTLLNPWRLMRLVLFFRRERVKCLVVNLPSDLKAAGLAARLAGVPKIIYQRGVAKPVRDSLLNRMLLKHIASHIIANSLETKRAIFARNQTIVNKEKVRVVYNGIDLKAFDGRSLQSLYARKPGEILLGHAGRLSAEKNQKFLIDVVRGLKDHGLSCTLLIAGTGPLEKELKSYAMECQVAENVIFLGFQENISAFMAGIDVFLLSSHSEGFGYVLIEAMAAHKPVVAFNHSSSPEIVIDGVTGFLVPFGNLEEYISKTMEISLNNNLKEQMGRAGRQRVEDCFEFEKTFQGLKEILSGANT